MSTLYSELRQSLLWAGLGPGCVLGWFGGGRGLTFAVKTYGFCTISNSSTGAAGAAGSGEVVARPAARTPYPTRAGGQDDGSYTNSLKLLATQTHRKTITFYDKL